MKETNLQKRLKEVSEPELAAFSSRLNPDNDPGEILGVRLPILRQLAAELEQNGEAEEFMRQLPHRYLEENQIHAILISRMRSYEACLQELKRFLPYADSWAVTDTIRPACIKKHLDEMKPVLNEWLHSSEPYTVRTAISLFMAYYLKDAFETEQAEEIAALRFDHYYVKMMAAWYMATALITQRDTILAILKEEKMDHWTHNRAIQKAIESRRITEEDKQILRAMRRKTE